jgi:hypothetical protein
MQRSGSGSLRTHDRGCNHIVIINSMEELNKAEKIVYETCRYSFLSLWTYARPRKPGSTKELCDILVVCEPDVIIFSVKDVKFKERGDQETNFLRWRREAIEASARQLYGAERALKTTTHVTKADGTPGLPFRDSSTLHYHRIAVAAGGGGKTPLTFGDFGKGFVHVFDEISFAIVLQELNTVSDFVSYLVAKERLYANNIATVFEGAEEDLLAFYLHQGRKFPTSPDLIVISDGL